MLRSQQHHKGDSKIKKLFAFLLAGMMACSASVSVAALEPKENPTLIDDSSAAYEKEDTSTRAIKDEQEPNGGRNNADIIKVGDTMNGTIDNASDLDAFKWIPTSSQKITITLSGPSGSRYDYDLWLQDRNGNELKRSAESGSDGRITYNVSKGTTYYVIVNSNKGYGRPYTVKITGDSSSSNGSLGIRRFQQEKKYWCWAAAVQMMNYFETGSKTSQSSIVTHIYGSPVDRTGRPSDQVDALKWIDSTTFADADYWSAGTEAYFDKYVVPNYNKGHATSLACTNRNGTGHALVVDEIDGDDVILIDPWGNEPNHRVSRDELFHSGFCSNAVKGRIYAAACTVY